tara:strand:- start:20860 stop:21063 length:204 start_codon:yes stop_codon:yes gene_type:complete
MTIAAGQKPVKALWNRLAPTNTVSHTKCGLTVAVNTMDNKTMKPAKAITLLSTDISSSLLGVAQLTT